MASIVNDLQADREAVAALRGMSVPHHRQAYSDRTAWIMACVSELAYIRFNELMSEAAQRRFNDVLEALIDEDRIEKVRSMLSDLAYDPSQETKELTSGLDVLKFKLDATFDRDGTQAIVVSCDEFVVLAFRGTEATSVKDIKADAKAISMKAPNEGRIHSGFDEAFRAVQSDIQKWLDCSDYSEKPLFITGHSLGGALATIAARRLMHSGGIAGCYTFGAPRVGDDDWIAWLKTPLYRLVNAADCVTMLPPGAIAIDVLSWSLSWIPAYGDLLQAWVLRKFGGYIHGGNMRYLTNCPAGQFEEVRLLYSVSLLTRIKGLIIRGLPWKHFLADHAISVYRKKLAIVAEARNSSSGAI